MDNLSAFIIGLALGETTNASKPSPPTPCRNIALQDVSFCQALRNLLDGIEDYVQKENPSPEQFFDLFYGKPVFEEPYTDDEKRQIRDYEWEKESYFRWVEIVGRDKWNSMPSIYRIWKTEDVSHIPDVENLDLLFALDDSQTPIKMNGRVYEYESISRKTAKGFFDDKLPAILFNKCVACSQAILRQHGFDYDYSRFEYNKSLDANPKYVINEEQWRKTYAQEFRSWQIESRKDAYGLLLEKHQIFVGKPWSIITKELYQYFNLSQLSNDNHIPNEERKRRSEEIDKLQNTLSENEKKRYINSISRKEPKEKWVEPLFYAQFVIAVIGILLLIGSNEVIIKVLGIICITFALLIMILYAVTDGFSNTSELNRQRLSKALQIRQAAYYNDTDQALKQEYEQLLQRIKN